MVVDGRNLAVQLSFHGLVPDDVHARRLLRGDDADMHGYTGQEEDDDREQGLGVAIINVSCASIHMPDFSYMYSYHIC